MVTNEKLKSDLVSIYIDDMQAMVIVLESIYYQRPEGISGTVFKNFQSKVPISLFSECFRIN